MLQIGSEATDLVVKPRVASAHLDSSKSCSVYSWTFTQLACAKRTAAMACTDNALFFLNESIYLSIYGWMDGWMDVWMYGCMDVWMDGWMDGWMHGCMDAWMHFFPKVALLCLSHDGRVGRCSPRW